MGPRRFLPVDLSQPLSALTGLDKMIDLGVDNGVQPEDFDGLRYSVGRSFI